MRYLLVLLFLTTLAEAHDPGITSNVIHRVFRIQFQSKSGTAFTIDVDGREYLVTAKHLIQKFSGTDTIELFSDDNWIKIQAVLVGHSVEPCDISILAVTRQLTPAGLPMQATADGIVYGQSVYFLGFPYGFVGKLVLGMDKFPLPFVKRATVSQIAKNPPLFYLDGHNNPGFSGGPVVFRSGNDQAMRVAAVISGYQSAKQPVYAGKSETVLSIQDNTGIIVAYGIDDAVKIIRSNPIGFVLPKEK